MSTEVGLLHIPAFDTFSFWSLWPFLIHLLPFFPIFLIISGCYNLFCYISSKLLFEFIPCLIKNLPAAYNNLLKLLEWAKLKLDVIIVCFFTVSKKKRKQKSRNIRDNLSVNEQTIVEVNNNSNNSFVAESTLVEPSLDCVANKHNKKKFLRYKKITSYPSFEAATCAMENKIENQLYVNRYFYEHSKILEKNN